jgi:hypothetical protein
VFYFLCFVLINCFKQQTNVTAVIGQSSFTAASNNLPSQTTLVSPRGMAMSTNGDLFIADRVMIFFFFFFKFIFFIILILICNAIFNILLDDLKNVLD